MEDLGKANLKELVNEKLWLSTINYQLEIGEIKMSTELKSMINGCKKNIKKLNKSLNYNK